MDKITTHGATAARWVYRNILSYILPRRRTVVRASLFTLLAVAPFMILVLVQRPLVGFTFLAIIGGLAYIAGFGEDVAKQLRWSQQRLGFCALIPSLMVRSTCLWP